MLRRGLVSLAAAAAAAGASPPVVVSEVGSCGRAVTLSREKSLNALNVPMVKQLLHVYREFHAARPDSLVVVQEGAGEKAFCAGGDVVSIVKDDPKGCRQQFFYDEYQADYLVATLPHPHIALWNGIVMGGGVGISAHGRYRVACEKSLFAMPETGIGLFPDVGGSWLLNKLRYPGLGLYLALTGHRLKGADIVHAGVATHYVPFESFGKLKRTLLESNPKDVGGILTEFETQPSEAKPFSLEPLLPRIEKAFGPQTESVENVLENLQTIGDDWAQAQIKTLSKMSPSSLKVSFECQRRAAKHKHLAETLAMEYNVVQRCMDTVDFNRGVTALLIDKTGEKPAWDPEELDLVTKDMVQAHFEKPSKAPVWDPEVPFHRAEPKL